MKRAMLTISAAMGLVLLGMQGPARSDCPPAGGNCPPFLDPVACIWATEMGTTCELGTLVNCACAAGKCSSGESRVPLDAGYELIMYSSRPEGCCADISWGLCFEYATRPCYRRYKCKPLNEFLDCDGFNPCTYSEDGTMNMTGWFTSLGSQCCVDMQ